MEDGVVDLPEAGYVSSGLLMACLNGSGMDISVLPVHSGTMTLPCRPSQKDYLATVGKPREA